MSAIHVDAAVASRHVSLHLTVPSRSVTAVVGPNGSGKTSLLHLVAGLLRPTEGSVRLGDDVLSDARHLVPTHRRRVALLTQRSGLFPHLSVLENVAFAPRAAGASREAARDRARAELQAVGCAALAERAAHALSGGQAQRVAIARALAADPLVVLLDEPMAGLDIGAAAELRAVLAERLRGRTSLLVTHEALDLWTIADRVAVVEKGRVVQTGPTDDLLARPTSSFLAQLGGLTLLVGVARDGALELPGGRRVQGLSDDVQPLHEGRPALAGIPPEAVSLHLEPPGGSPRNALPAVISAVEPRGPVVRVRLDVGGQQLAADVTSQSLAGMGLRPGSAVWAVVKAVQVRLYGR
ncbi:MAG TPA: TOBE-like domain-containing protein [Propionibacteriaceae bacterium]|nr:TOBE-like domain-containing protein [Propionibacteriaceae bacterium]